MKKIKLILGMLLFGSLWGFSEVILGPLIGNGAILTGIFALSFLFLSRMIFRFRGMQLGMGLIACLLKIFDPIGGTCMICSGIAIAAEAAIFEIIFYKIENLDLKNFHSITLQSSLGIFTAYVIYVGGYIITQILTPLSQSSFYFTNLFVKMPGMLSTGLIAALSGAITIPVILQTKKLDIKLKDRLYYPTTIGISALCWIIIITNFIIFS